MLGHPLVIPVPGPTHPLDSVCPVLQPFAPFVHGHAGINQDHLAFDYRPAFVLLRSALLSNGREGLPALSECM